MQMIIRKDSESILINADEKVVERYNLSESIDFKELVGKLISLELTEKIVLSVEDFTKNEQEKQLISLIREIIDNYNEKVDLYNEFLIEKEKNNNTDKVGNSNGDIQ